MHLSTKPELNQNYDYWLWDEEKINKYLGKFWFEVKTQDGDYYRVSTLEHLHYGLNRCLKRKGHAYNILKSPQFKHLQEQLVYAWKHLKSLGYGYIELYKEIKPAGSFKFTFFSLERPKLIVLKRFVLKNL